MMRKDDLKPREKGVHYQAQADGSMPAAFRPAPQRQRSFANVNPSLSAIYNKPSPAEGFVVNDEEGRFEAPGKGGSLPGAGRRKYAGGL